MTLCASPHHEHFRLQDNNADLDRICVGKNLVSWDPVLGTDYLVVCLLIYWKAARIYHIITYLIFTTHLSNPVA